MRTKSERVDRIMAEVKGRRVLHVGCVGEAETKHEMHLRLCQDRAQEDILGIDINGAGVEELRARGLNVEVADAERLQFNECFDTVVAGELIEHLSNPGAFLAGCARSLRADGRVVLSTPNPFSFMYGLMYAKNYTRAFNPGHALWLCPQTLTQLAHRHGLRVTRMMFVDDLCPELVASRWYKLFAGGWRLIRRFLPERFRNTLVAVLERP